MLSLYFLDVIGTLAVTLATVLSRIENGSIEPKDSQFVELLLHLIRNLLLISDMPISKDDINIGTNDTFIMLLHQEGILDVIPTIVNSLILKREWNTTILDVLYLIFVRFDPEQLYYISQEESAKEHQKEEKKKTETVEFDEEGNLVTTTIVTTTKTEIEKDKTPLQTLLKMQQTFGAPRNRHRRSRMFYDPIDRSDLMGPSADTDSRSVSTRRKQQLGTVVKRGLAGASEKAALIRGDSGVEYFSQSRKQVSYVLWKYAKTIIDTSYTTLMSTIKENIIDFKNTVYFHDKVTFAWMIYFCSSVFYFAHSEDQPGNLDVSPLVCTLDQPSFLVIIGLFEECNLPSASPKALESTAKALMAQLRLLLLMREKGNDEIKFLSSQLQMNLFYEKNLVLDRILALLKSFNQKKHSLDLLSALIVSASTSLELVEPLAKRGQLYVRSNRKKPQDKNTKESLENDLEKGNADAKQNTTTSEQKQTTDNSSQMHQENKSQNNQTVTYDRNNQQQTKERTSTVLLPETAQPSNDKTVEKVISNNGTNNNPVNDPFNIASELEEFIKKKELQEGKKLDSSYQIASPEHNATNLVQTTENDNKNEKHDQLQQHTLIEGQQDQNIVNLPKESSISLQASTVPSTVTGIEQNKGNELSEKQNDFSIDDKKVGETNNKMNDDLGKPKENNNKTTEEEKDKNEELPAQPNNQEEQQPRQFDKNYVEFIGEHDTITYMEQKLQYSVFLSQFCNTTIVSIIFNVLMNPEKSLSVSQSAEKLFKKIIGTSGGKALCFRLSFFKFFDDLLNPFCVRKASYIGKKMPPKYDIPKQLQGIAEQIRQILYKFFTYTTINDIDGCLSLLLSKTRREMQLAVGEVDDQNQKELMRQWRRERSDRLSETLYEDEQESEDEQEFDFSIVDANDQEIQYQKENAKKKQKEQKAQQKEKREDKTEKPKETPEEREQRLGQLRAERKERQARKEKEKRRAYKPGEVRQILLERLHKVPSESETAKEKLETDATPKPSTSQKRKRLLKKADDEAEGAESSKQQANDADGHQPETEKEPKRKTATKVIESESDSESDSKSTSESESDSMSDKETQHSDKGEDAELSEDGIPPMKKSRIELRIDELDGVTPDEFKNIEIAPDDDFY